jgi:hypothetical protein
MSKLVKNIIKETVYKPGETRRPEEQNFLDQHKVDVKDYPVKQDTKETPSKKKRLADNDAAKAEAEYDQAYLTKEETEISEAHGMVCKDCGDEYGKPTTDCEHDCNDPDGDHWVEKDMDEGYGSKKKMKSFKESLQPVVEAEEVSEAVIDDLKSIVKSKSMKEVKFADGTKMKVDMTTASAMTQVHDALNSANKKKFADAINKNQTMFMKMADFAFSGGKK